LSCPLFYNSPPRSRQIRFRRERCSTGSQSATRTRWPQLAPTPFNSLSTSGSNRATEALGKTRSRSFLSLGSRLPGVPTAIANVADSDRSARQIIAARCGTLLLVGLWTPIPGFRTRCTVDAFLYSRGSRESESCWRFWAPPWRWWDRATGPSMPGSSTGSTSILRTFRKIDQAIVRSGGELVDQIVLARGLQETKTREVEKMLGLAQ